MISPFLNRRHGVEAVAYQHPLLEEALAESHGVVVYHEQVMKVIAAMTGYDLAECDRIRRHLADDLEVEKIEPDFLRGARERGVPERTPGHLGKVLQFASFGFCKAHAAAFAVPTYQSAWLKAHYPAHFLAGVLTHEPGMYPRRLILEDARPPRHPHPAPGRERLRARVHGRGKVERSEGSGIRLGLKDVAGISDAEIRSILRGSGRAGVRRRRGRAATHVARPAGGGRRSRMRAGSTGSREGRGGTGCTSR